MFQRIVVPLDGSERAERALPVAAAPARSGGGSVLLLQVMTPQALSGISMEGSPPAPEVFEPERAEVTSYLDHLASREMFEDVQTPLRVVEGMPAEAILETAAAFPADLIVMSSRGRSGFTRWLLGSVTQKVARHSAVPVLVVPERRGRKGAANCEVMAVATHGRSGLSLWVMGSVAERVLEATGLPLLIVRARQSEVQTMREVVRLPLDVMNLIKNSASGNSIRSCFSTHPFLLTLSITQHSGSSALLVLTCNPYS